MPESGKGKGAKRPEKHGTRPPRVPEPSSPPHRHGTAFAETAIQYKIRYVTNFTTPSSDAILETFFLDLLPPVGYPSNLSNPVFTTPSRNRRGSMHMAEWFFTIDFVIERAELYIFYIILPKSPEEYESI
jgi:hypothetical protein